MLISLEQAKEYLRIDGDAENSTVETLLKSALNLCQDVARLDESAFESAGEISKVAVLFALGYFYEHREDADHSKLVLILRSLLFGIRKEAF